MLYNNILFSNKVGVIIGNTETLTIIYANRASANIAKQINTDLKTKHIPEILVGKKIDSLFKNKIDLIMVTNSILNDQPDYLITKIGKYSVEFHFSRLKTLTINLNKFVITWSIRNDISNINASDNYKVSSFKESIQLAY